MAVTTIHLVRHGRVASHRGDMPITEEGHAEIRAAGLRLAQEVRPEEEIHFLCTTTTRTRETADTLYASLKENLGPNAPLRAPREEWALRNPDLFLAGYRVEMVSTPEAMALQIPESGLTPAQVDAVAFFKAFFRSPDRIGYWLNHSDPPGENTAAVGRRLVAFCASLPYNAEQKRRRYVCVTHSPVLRAVLMHCLQQDPGEPEWVERIDLSLDPNGGTITFRDQAASLRP
jgi:broad specificity phosphatase PhoE